MQHPDEGMIHAWIDGALTVDEAASVESHAGHCDECSAAIAEARGLVAASSRILLALDDVPRGVIPAAGPRPRSWYARNELRAAAAVLLVASASLVLTRGGLDAPSTMQDVAALATDTSEVTAPPEARSMNSAPAQAREKLESRAANVERPKARDETAVDAMAQQGATTSRADISSRPSASEFSVPPAEAPRSSAPAPAPVAPMLRDRNAVATNEADLSAKAGGGAASVGSASARRPGSSHARLSEGVVTGATSKAATSAPANVTVVGVTPLRIVRADTAKRVKTIVYEATKGIEVTFTETEPVDFSQKSSIEGRAAGAAIVTPSAPLAPPAINAPVSVAARAQTAMRAVPINTISWADSATGRTYTLAGALPRGELEALKARIVAQRKPGFPPSRE